MLLLFLVAAAVHWLLVNSCSLCTAGVPLMKAMGKPACCARAALRASWHAGAWTISGDARRARSAATLSLCVRAGAGVEALPVLPSPAPEAALGGLRDERDGPAVLNVELGAGTVGAVLSAGS